MVNKCVVFGCTSGYKSSGEKVSTFELPFKNLGLLKKWIKSVVIGNQPKTLLYAEGISKKNFLIEERESP